MCIYVDLMCGLMSKRYVDRVFVCLVGVFIIIPVVVVPACEAAASSSRARSSDAIKGWIDKVGLISAG